MKAKLIRTVEIKSGFRTYTHYVYECIECGAEFIREQCHDRINPYCGSCNKKIQRARNYELKAKKQAEHDAKVRAEVINECSELFAETMTNMTNICGTNCPIKCNWGTEETCKDMCKKWFIEQLRGGK